MTNAVPGRLGGRLRLPALALAALLALTALPAVAALGDLVSVVVLGDGVAASRAAVSSAGGVNGEPLWIVHGTAAEVPERRLAELSRRVTVVPNRTIRMQGASYDGGSLATAYLHEVGAPALWSNGVAGAGVTVAVVDTGVADVPDLAGRVVATADLSGENSYKDGYGHGTFMAGLIAGTGASSSGAYVGVAPEASLLSVKVAGADGSTTLTKVLTGLQVVSQSRVQYGVRVLLLAADSGSPLPPELDPLSIALRRLWHSGITVVVPAGNDGDGPGTISPPGEDPVLLTAGSVDDRGTASVLDDLPSEFTGRGPTRWGDEKPDLAAPGEHLVSLRAPGSTVDTSYATARVGDAYFKGTGTSMSAAVTAGAAALLLSARPELGPDEVKASLMGSANPLPAGEADTTGAGVVNAADAAALPALGETLSSVDIGDDTPPAARGLWQQSNGVSHKNSPARWVGEGDLDNKTRVAAVEDWSARQWAKDSWEARQWTARQWAARQWTARQWAARQWMARQWAARQWAGDDWAARQWTARQWTFDDWAARQWTARQWTARQWTLEDFESANWEARQWAARQWTAEQWEARQWSARQWSARQWAARQWSARSWA